MIIAKINNRTYKCDIAATEEERRKGLQGVENLPSDRGMVFFHNKKKRHPYWMYNTEVPLTILFIDKDKKVIDVDHRKDLGSMAQSVPEKPVQIVLEIPYNKNMDDIKGSKIELIKMETACDRFS